jgi:glycosyltransferase involved in cell wall biosynthesis
MEHYRGKLLGKVDVVIDEINTIPFFTPLWADVPTFVMIWQLAREVWWYESPFPLNAAGYMLEPLYLRAYRHTPAFTFSESTRSDLRRLGFKGTVTMVPAGIESFRAPDVPKNAEPTFIYVGRLAPSKRVHDIVEAFAIFRNMQHRGRLILMGTGSPSYERRITGLASRLGVDGYIERCGWQRGIEKYRRMAEAHILLMASAREGWGLVVTEANACGTPAVVYDVPGLRDSVRHRETGLVVAPTPRNLADGMAELVGDQSLYARLQRSAKDWSRAFTFDAGFRVVKDGIAGIGLS